MNPRYAMLIVALLMCCCCVIGWAEEVSSSEYESPRKDGKSVRVSIGELVPAELLSDIATASRPALGYRPVAVELRLGERLIPVLQYLHPESTDPSAQGFQVLAADVAAGGIVMVCSVGPVLDLQYVPVPGPGSTQHLMLLPHHWSTANHVTPLKAGEVVASIRRGNDDKRWQIEITDMRAMEPHPLVFEQEGDGWSFRKIDSAHVATSPTR